MDTRLLALTWQRVDVSPARPSSGEADPPRSARRLAATACGLASPAGPDDANPQPPTAPSSTEKAPWIRPSNQRPGSAACPASLVKAAGLAPSIRWLPAQPRQFSRPLGEHGSSFPLCRQASESGSLDTSSMRLIRSSTAAREGKCTKVRWNNTPARVSGKGAAFSIYTWARMVRVLPGWVWEDP